MSEHVDAYVEKMRAEKLPEQAIDCFRAYYLRYRRGTIRTEVPESEIAPPREAEMPRLEALEAGSPEDLETTVMIKLNGGLGTSMGLSKAKSLLEVKSGTTFLDAIALQALSSGVRLMFMNSYSTRRDTLEHLRNYPALRTRDMPLDFVQNKFPRIDVESGAPLTFGDERDWNPPGHGDLYLAIQADGLLEDLVRHGYRYAFVSNSDNLGAVPDARIPAYMATRGVPFLLEACRRGPMDSKGGHLAIRRSDERLILRESAQRPRDGEDQFEDIDVYRWFNTNNLWIDLRELAELLARNDGWLDLPLIGNPKTVEGIDVVQLETAMGSAIEVFDGANAIVVPRERFAPVKKTNDLLVLRSDVYELDSDSGRTVPTISGQLPVVDLDEDHYKTIDQLAERFPQGAPSLRHCSSLTVRGEVTFTGGVTLRNEVKIIAEAPAVLDAGDYTGTIEL